MGKEGRGDSVTLSYVVCTMPLRQLLVSVAEWGKSKSWVCVQLCHSAHRSLSEPFGLSKSHPLMSKKETVIVLACVSLGPVRRQKPQSNLNRGGVMESLKL